MSELLLSRSFDFAYIFKSITTKWYYYVFASAAIISLICFFFFKKQPERNTLGRTQKIVYASVLTALSAVANIVDIKINDALQISLVASVCFVSGYLMGGGYGFAIGFIGDLIGAIVMPKGPYNPIVGLGTGMWGLIFGLAFTMFRGNEYLKTVVSYIVCVILITAGINTVGFCLMYPQYYSFEWCLTVLPFRILVAAGNCIVCCVFVNVLPRVLPKDKFNLIQKESK